MLQPTINTSVLRTAPAAPADAEGAVPGDFAALLALDPGAGGAQPAAEAAPLMPSTELPIRQPDLQSGNILPAVLPLVLPFAVKPAHDAVTEQVEPADDAETASDISIDAEPSLQVDQPVVVPVVIHAAIPALPVEPVPIETAAELAGRSRTSALPEPTPPQPKVTADAAERPTVAPQPFADRPAIRFVQPVAQAQDMAPSAETAKLVAARTAAQPIADNQPQPAAEAVATTVKASAAKIPDLGDGPPIAAAAYPVATETQPATVARDPMQGASLPQALPSAASAAVSRPAPHDFATLVDRLMEARDAAGAHPVTAAVAHAEFGRVSLRFNQHDGAMSVAMTSADPGFAPAVAAATAAAQPSLQQQDSGSRQGTEQSQQQGAAQSGHTSAQAQSHGSAQGSARGADRAGQQNFDRTADRQSETPADTGDSDVRRRGIYA